MALVGVVALVQSSPNPNPEALAAPHRVSHGGFRGGNRRGYGGYNSHRGQHIGSFGHGGSFGHRGSLGHRGSVGHRGSLGHSGHRVGHRGGYYG